MVLGLEKLNIPNNVQFFVLSILGWVLWHNLKPHLPPTLLPDDLVRLLDTTIPAVGLLAAASFAAEFKKKVENAEVAAVAAKVVAVDTKEAVVATKSMTEDQTEQLNAIQKIAVANVATLKDIKAGQS